MSNALTSQMVNFGSTVYHTDEFFAFVKTHEQIIKESSVSTPLDIGVVHKLEYNFVSLLIELRYPLENLAFFMIANDLIDPTDMTIEMVSMNLPDEALMDRLKDLYRQKAGRI